MAGKYFIGVVAKYFRLLAGSAGRADSRERGTHYAALCRVTLDFGQLFFE
jgi:hypothetical protein